MADQGTTHRFRFEELENRDRLFQEAIEVADAVPYYQDYLKNQYEYVQPGIQELIGYSADEFTPELWEKITKEIILLGDLKGLSLEEAVQKSRGQEGVSWRADYRILTKEGQERWLSNAAVQVRDDDGKVVGSLGILQDITERKSLENQLRHSQKMEAIGQLAGGIAHNINNLLTGVMGNLSLAREKAPKDIQHYLDNVNKAANRAADLVRELLAFSRKSHVDLEPVNLNYTMQEVYQLIRDTFDRRIEVVLDLAENLPYVYADSAQLYTVLMNLSINARDALEKVIHSGERQDEIYKIVLKTGTHHVDEEFRKTHSTLNVEHCVVVSISDNGCGMNPDTQKHIFEPFYTTKPAVGTGLGLASAFGIIEQHNGWIDFSSTEGKGTTFNLYLPAYQQEINRTSRQEDVIHEISRGTETILLVDDEEMVINVGTEILENYGYKVLTAKNGVEALHQFRQFEKEIDLIILDLSMPQMSGAEFLKRIHSENKPVKVIISSGHAQGYQPNTLERLGVSEVVVKPYLPNDLLLKVREILDKN